MKNIEKIFLFVFFYGMFFYSCKKDKNVEAPVDFGYNYFPDEVGRYVIYEVDSIFQDDVSNVHDTTRYLLKELIATSFTDLSGRPTLRIERYFKYYNDTVPYSAMAWLGPRVWFVNRTSSELEKVEENVRYIKLVFPAMQGKKWNGNAYNIFGAQEYKITSTDQADLIGSIGFDSVTVVNQYEENNLIKHRLEIEKFARNVGLIYKQKDSVGVQPSSSSDFPPYDDTTGYRFSQKIISYGK